MSNKSYHEACKAAKRKWDKCLLLEEQAPIKLAHGVVHSYKEVVKKDDKTFGGTGTIILDGTSDEVVRFNRYSHADDVQPYSGAKVSFTVEVLNGGKWAADMCVTT